MNGTMLNGDGVVGVNLKNGVWTDTDESEFGGAIMDPDPDLLTSFVFMANVGSISMEEPVINLNEAISGEH